VSPLEAALDALEEAIRAAEPFVDRFREARRLAEERYRSEAPLLEKLARLDSALTAKMAAQHSEALEIADRLEEALGACQSGDVTRLARRFHAIVQHNIIEEERDVWPLVTLS
jgi:hypothetical protein